MISSVYFADYYWGNTNAAIIALDLLSYYFALREPALDLRVVRIPGYAVSALFLAVDTFKVTAAVLIFPFWLAMNRKRLRPALGLLVLLIAVLNSVVVFEPVLLYGYFAAVFSQPQAVLWQLYEFVWYYALPLAGVVLLGHRRSEDSPREA